MNRVLFFLLIAVSANALAQEIPVHIRNDGVYDLLYRLNALDYAEGDFRFAPLSYNEVYYYLDSVPLDDVHSSSLKKEITNRLGRLSFDYDPSGAPPNYPASIFTSLGSKKFIDFNPDLYRYRDNRFSLRFKPLLSYEFYSNGSGAEYWRRSGIAFTAGIGGHWGFWGSLSDNYESLRFAEETYLTPRPGANYKLNSQGGEYSDTRGGVSYSWDWGNIMLAKDNIRWGSGYHGSSIFSGRTPSFPFIKLNFKPIKWLEFNYFHGWLVSEVIDSSRTGWYTNAYGTERREYFYDKYIAANMFTIRPCKGLNISFGNSIVYSDDNPKFAYFIPFLFWKSMDHTLTGAGSSRLGQNAQMFFDISSFQVRHLHLYTSLFVDEVSFSRFWDKEEHSNFIGLKIGAAVYDLPFNNLRAVIEYTRNNPLTYRHNTPLTTFESNRYNLGHYLADNADELYLSLRWSPLPMSFIQASYTGIRKGPDYTALGSDRLGLPFMENVSWKYQVFEVLALYRPLPYLGIKASVAYGNSAKPLQELYAPSFYHDKKTTFTLGLDWNY